MRKLFLLFVVISITQKVAALIHTVFVTSNQFTPSNTTNVWVGDTMRFSFKGGGFHNVSSLSVKNSVPKNALQIFSGVPQSVNRVYDYIVFIPSEYLYICEVNLDGASFTGMASKFTAENNGQLIASVLYPKENWYLKQKQFVIISPRNRKRAKKKVRAS